MTSDSKNGKDTCFNLTRHFNADGKTYHRHSNLKLTTKLNSVTQQPMRAKAYYAHLRSFAMREKGGNRLVPGSDYMVDELKLPNQAPRGFGESLQKCVAWRCPDGSQLLFCWPIQAVSGQSLASNGPVAYSTDQNLVFGHVEATSNK
ncbi:hypothetical protein TNCV_2576131 [Trichonephila clavipes]|uniref:Uncharacterized protein n=1 Tax=Trichonephila clavipes TaxID=2585209 RepID=A0A8X6UQV1_TRICX|nr:hypothetical protein TNCV_2576131 [Trichonephila clavipes]